MKVFSRVAVEIINFKEYVHYTLSDVIWEYVVALMENVRAYFKFLSYYQEVAWLLL